MCSHGTLQTTITDTPSSDLTHDFRTHLGRPILRRLLLLLGSSASRRTRCGVVRGRGRKSSRCWESTESAAAPPCLLRGLEAGEGITASCDHKIDGVTIADILAYLLNMLLTWSDAL